MPWPGSRFSSRSALGRLIMGVRDETLQRVKRPFSEKRIMGNSLLAVVSTRRPSQGSVSADAELVGWIGIRPGRPLWSTRTQRRRSICIEG